MKVKHRSLMAGSTAAFLIASAAVASVGVVAVVQTSFDGLDYLPAGYQSATIYVTGVDLGEATVGVLGTGLNPWNVMTDSPGGFWNLSASKFGVGGTSPFSAHDFQFVGPFGGDAIYDSGLIGLGSWTLHAVLGEKFGSSADGGNEVDVIGAHISSSPDGSPNEGNDHAQWVEGKMDVDPSWIPILVATWDENYGASGSFVFATVGDAEYQLAWSVPAIPAPGALALLGLAGLIGARRRRS